MRTSSLKSAGLALGFLATAALPSVASAASYAITSAAVDSTPGYGTGKVTYTGSPGVSTDAYVGRIALSTAAGPNQTTFRTYCVDLFDTLHAGTFTEKAYGAANLASGIKQATFNFTSTQVSNLAAFLENADAIVGGAGATKTQSAAAQLGVWEILFEKSGTAYDVKSGQFSASGGDLADALTLANTWLGNLTTTDPSRKWSQISGQSIGLLDAGEGNQQQAYVIRTTDGNMPGAVPEPASWAMMLAGFGAVGTMVRRRRAPAFA